jgi:hypothetical protein
MPSVAGGVAAVVVAVAIYAGSRGLRYFDAALVGYATATVFLAFGVVYRYAVWVSSPPARRYLRRGWQAFFSWRNFRSMPTAVPARSSASSASRPSCGPAAAAAGSPTSFCSGAWCWPP